MNNAPHKKLEWQTPYLEDLSAFDVLTEGRNPVSGKYSDASEFTGRGHVPGASIDLSGYFGPTS